MWKLSSVLILIVSAQAFAVTAFFTGKQRNGTSVTGKMAISCQYEYGGSKFWKTFVDTYTCPMSVEVE